MLIDAKVYSLKTKGKVLKQIFKIIILILITGFNFNVDAKSSLTTLEFDKKIDYQDWVQKINLSFKDLISNLQRQINLYRFSHPLDTSDSYSNSFEIKKIFPIPHGLLSYYKQDISIGRAQGIYIPAHEHELGANNRPIILLREDSDHWTLIHEYTHHLFHLARKQMNTELPKGYLMKFKDAAETLQEYHQKLKANYLKFESEEQEKMFLECLTIATDLMLKINMSVTLEEIVVEKMIRDFYKKNPKSANLPDQGNLQNSAKYTQSSLELVDMSLNSYKEIIKDYLVANNKNESNIFRSHKIKVLDLSKQIGDLELQIRNFQY